MLVIISVQAAVIQITAAFRPLWAVTSKGATQASRAGISISGLVAWRLSSVVQREFQCRNWVAGIRPPTAAPVDRLCAGRQETVEKFPQVEIGRLPRTGILGFIRPYPQAFLPVLSLRLSGATAHRTGRPFGASAVARRSAVSAFGATSAVGASIPGRSRCSYRSAQIQGWPAGRDEMYAGAPALVFAARGVA